MTSDELTIKSTSPDETERLGAVFATLIPSGSVVALRGDLAAGKTCLVRGLAQGFHSADWVTSPTFTLVNEYEGDTKLYHLDLYRLDSAYEMIDLGYEELFDPDNAITVVEWAERAETLLPQKRVDVYLEYGGEEIRTIRIVNRECLPHGWQQSLQQTIT
ncbi:MAG: tRNA (adenosine(37)-N6)-threonylcarbamoyltransferase complex ATPase subunit type 1 TsaE [Candidatus Hydrogenedentota bacterium]|nr:MAG: tRNA (adenosine(37)-N6)-threonylcarbamoyltransferase complex ATPase subunit type 1 TsaE [Candidatus Hydrogenedentota bacterium]